MKKISIKTIKDIAIIALYILVSLALIILLGMTSKCAVCYAEEDINYFDIGCRVYHSQNQPVNGLTVKILNFDSEEYDNYDMHDCVNDNSKVTINHPGKYLITTCISFQSDCRGLRSVRILNNGENIVVQQHYPVSGTSTHFTVSTVANLNTGDYVEVAVWHDAPITLNVQYIPDYASYLEVQRIGIGEETMGIDISLPTGFYVMIFGLGLLFISFFIKSPLISLAVIACMISCIYEPEFKDTYYQTGCVIVAVWAGITFFIRMFKVFSGGE